jgi:hypothetical protein
MVGYHRRSASFALPDAELQLCTHAGTGCNWLAVAVAAAR